MKFDEGPRLRDLQRLLYRLITASDGVSEGLAADSALKAGGLNEIIAGDERMGSADRLGIYADAYFFRLLDVCKEDFPATVAAIGEGEFHNLITGYLMAYPSDSPSVLYVGSHLG